MFAFSVVALSVNAKIKNFAIVDFLPRSFQISRYLQV